MNGQRLRLALGGLFGVVVLLAAAVTAIAYSAGAFDDDPEVTAVVPASAGPLRANAPVQYRGVVVGTVADIRAGVSESTLSLDLAPGELGSVPASVKVRLVPRTVFGDQYVDLVAPAGTTTAALRPGARIPHDDSAPAAQLYAVATKLYQLLTAVRPAQLSEALGVVADTLRGKGNTLGGLIDRAHDMLGGMVPLTNTLLDELPSVSKLTDQLAASAPDLFRSLDDAVALSGTLVSHQDDLGRLLTAGTQAGAAAESLLLDNADRTIQLVHNAGPLLDTAAAHPGAATATVRGLGDLMSAVGRAFSHGPWVSIKAPLTLDDPYAYTAADCPRYGDLAGPNCRSARPPVVPPPPVPDGGSVGSVGSEPEKSQLAEVVPAPASTDLLSVLVGPILRGSKVVTGG
jgi:phospholipid/cholesterol/gamma-HCH transport system substrate-binding protein